MEDLTKDLPEYSGKLLQNLFDDLVKPSEGTYTHSLKTICYEMIESIINLRANYTNNLGKLDHHNISTTKVLHGMILRINTAVWDTFYKYVRVLVICNIDQEKITNSLNQCLEDQGLLEIFGSESNPLFSLENYCKHLITTQGIFFHKLLPGYNTIKALIAVDPLVAIIKQETAFKKYSFEILGILDSLSLDLCVKLNQLIDANRNSQGLTPTELSNLQNSLINEISIHLFLIYNLGEIDYNYLCEHYKSKK